jgi:hypothetical protein
VLKINKIIDLKYDYGDKTSEEFHETAAFAEFAIVPEALFVRYSFERYVL